MINIHSMPDATTPFFKAPTWADECASIERQTAEETYRQTMEQFERAFGVSHKRLRLAYGPNVMTQDASTHYIDGQTGVHYAYRRLLKRWEIEKEDAHIGKPLNDRDCYCCAIC